MPRFSVVIPAHDAQAFIDECLDSVDGQTCADYEIMVVDDGSRDETRRRIEEWSGRHPQRRLRLHPQPNRGIGGARNAGVVRAGGDFVAFLDADDAWLPAKLERVAAHLDAHPDDDLVCHDEWLVDASGGRRRLRHGPYARYEELLFNGNPVSTSAAVVRRTRIAAAGGFSEDLRYNGAEDYDLWLRLARDGCRFAYLHEVLGRYRVHEGGITSDAERHCRNTLNVLAAHAAARPPRGLRERYGLRRHRAAIIRSAVHTLMKQGRRSAAWRLVARAAREDPLSWKTWALGLMHIARATP